MGMLAKIQRLRYRKQLPIREIARRTGLSRNTVRQWLRREGAVEPGYPARKHFTKLDAFAEFTFKSVYERRGSSVCPQYLYDV